MNNADSNVALEMMHIALSTIDGTRAEPHKIAMIAGAMYEQYAVYTGALTPLEATPPGATMPCDADCEAAIVKAGYFAIKMVLTGGAIPPMLRRFDKLAEVDAKLKVSSIRCSIETGHDHCECSRNVVPVGSKKSEDIMFKFSLLSPPFGSPGTRIRLYRA